MMWMKEAQVLVEGIVMLQDSHTGRDDDGE
jgi:hypothetical protein